MADIIPSVIHVRGPMRRLLRVSISITGTVDARSGTMSDQSDREKQAPERLEGKSPSKDMIDRD